MTDTLKLTQRQRRILELLANFDAPVSRQDLADADGKRAWPPHDIDLLHRLVDAGLVEMTTVTVGIRQAYRYALKKARNDHDGNASDGNAPAADASPCIPTDDERTTE